MTSVRRFSCRDLFSFNAVNLDYFTETVRPRRRRCPALFPLRSLTPLPPWTYLQYNLSFYMQYLARWPEYCLMAVAPDQRNQAYSESGTSVVLASLMDV